MDKKIVQQVEDVFQNYFNMKPLLVFSPGRINLIGEHTDYNDGFVFPAAIDKGIVLALNRSESKTSKVHALNKEEVYEFNLNSISPLKDGGWRNYILGVVSELQKSGCIIENFNAVFAGDIPTGAGMSSSAALENSFVFGLNVLFDLGLSRDKMILISQKAEHNYAGVKCGIMDQYASMFGVENSALLLDCRTIKSEAFNIDFKSYTIMLINSNVKHDLSETAYNDRRLVCENVSNLLNIKALRDANQEDLKTIKNEITQDDYEKVLYVIEEIDRVGQFSKAIKKDDLDTLGELLYQSHEGLSHKYKVSCEELDFLVDETKDNPNILGARMMGGGFGGCTINLIRKDHYEEFAAKVSERFRLKFGKECSFYSVKLSQGTHLIE